MKWRYGITREKTAYGDVYAIREIYTDADGGVSWTERPVTVQGDSVEEVLETLHRMSRDARSGRVLDISAAENSEREGQSNG